MYHFNHAHLTFDTDWLDCQSVCKYTPLLQGHWSMTCLPPGPSDQQSTFNDLHRHFHQQIQKGLTYHYHQWSYFPRSSTVLLTTIISQHGCKYSSCKNTKKRHICIKNNIFRLLRIDNTNFNIILLYLIHEYLLKGTY
jgi:hypothetical protein